MIQSLNQYRLVCDVIECASREEWLAIRRSGIGASESASVFGVGYAGTSPVTLWASKTKGYEPEFAPDQLRRMNRGKLMEPIIAQEFSEDTGLAIHDPGEFTVFRSQEHTWLFATLDRVAIDDDYGPVPVEIKNVSGLHRSEWNQDEEPPLKYNVQCQHQMAVTGAGLCYLVALVGGDELVIRSIKRNERFIAAMLSNLDRFWGYVTRNEMPPIDESEATGMLLSWLYPKDKGTTVCLPSESVDWDSDLESIKGQIKTLEAKKTHLENLIKAAIGSNTRGELFNGGAYTLKSQSREDIDRKRLTSEFPDVAKSCSKVTEFRVLRRTNK